MESSVTQSIQIYPENHEFDENILSTERGGWDETFQAQWEISNQDLFDSQASWIFEMYQKT